jgi:hypothetical protein
VIDTDTYDDDPALLAYWLTFEKAVLPGAPDEVRHSHMLAFMAGARVVTELTRDADEKVPNGAEIGLRMLRQEVDVFFAATREATREETRQ